jgi:hypothetical protein
MLGRALVALLLVCACGDPATPEGSLVIGRLVFLEGDHQTDTVGQPLPRQVVVSLRDVRTLRPLEGYWISVLALEGTAAAATDSPTDRNGIVRFTWTLGGVPGEQRLVLSAQNNVGGTVAVDTAFARAVPPTPSPGEPNDTSSAANLIVLGDSVRGVIDLGGDVDYYAIDLPTGTQMDLAFEGGMDITVRFVAPDSTTTILEADRGDFRFRSPGSARYFMRVRHRDHRAGGPTHTYVLRPTVYLAPVPGPGDPVREIAAFPTNTNTSVEAGPGYFWVVRWGRSPVQVDLLGDTLAVIDSAFRGTATALDRSGNLLIGACKAPPDLFCGGGAIWRVSPTGAIAEVVAVKFQPQDLVVAPDGAVWSTGSGDTLWRFDSLAVATHVSTGLQRPAALTFSPSGELLFIAERTLYKLVDGAPQKIIDFPSNTAPSSIAFDRDGFVYVAFAGIGPWDDYSRNGKITLYDPDYRVVHDPFAIVDNGFEYAQLRQVLFARQADGSMTKRLFALHDVQANQPPYDAVWSLVELNPAAIRAPGWQP